MRVYKSDGTYVDDTKDTEFGWYFSEIEVDEGVEHFEEYNKQAKGLSRLRKSITKENLLESIDLPPYPSITTPSLATLVENQLTLMKTKPNHSATTIYEHCVKNEDCDVPSREDLAAMMNPCNIEPKVLLSVDHDAIYKSLIAEEATEELLKSLTKENLLESIVPLYPSITTPLSATLEEYQLDLMKTKPNHSATTIYENCVKNVDCDVSSREDLAARINPCNIESKESVVHNAKYKSLIAEESTEELMKSVNFETTSPKCLINERRDSLTEAVYNEIRNYHANKEENMMSLMMELILADANDLIGVPKLEMNEFCTESPNSITTTSDLGNSIHSSNSSRETHKQDRDNLTVSRKSHIASSIGLGEEYKSIQDFCSETYEMRLKLAEIRRSFQDLERKVDKLFKQAAELSQRNHVPRRYFTPHDEQP